MTNQVYFQTVFSRNRAAEKLAAEQAEKQEQPKPKKRGRPRRKEIK
jgi:hypothetical protein